MTIFAQRIGADCVLIYDCKGRTFLPIYNNDRTKNIKNSSMTDMEQTFKTRLMKFIAFTGMPLKTFEEMLGFSNGAIRNMRSGLSIDKLERIAKFFPILNKDWLTSGEGEMIIKEEYEKRMQMINGANARGYMDAIHYEGVNGEQMDKVKTSLDEVRMELPKVSKSVSASLDNFKREIREEIRQVSENYNKAMEMLATSQQQNSILMQRILDMTTK